jgi:hypothetical protein
MALSDPFFSPGDVLRRMQAIESQQRVSSRSLSGTTIKSGGILLKDDGTIRVEDQTGAIVLTVGKLPSGDYGLSATNAAGQSVELSTVAFGEVSDFIATSQTLNLSANTWGDLATVGPRVTNVEVGNSGRVRVQWGAGLSPGASNSGGLPSQLARMGIEVSGPTTIAPSTSRAAQIGYTAGGTASIAGNMSASFTTLFSGLTPGLYTFTCKYMTANANNGSAANRFLIVQPY